MSAIDGVGVELRGAVAILTMTNPGRRNAFYSEMRRRISTLLAEYAVNPDIRAVVLTGADGHFCAGADLNRGTTQRALTPLEVRETMRDVHALLRLMVSGAKPLIAAVEGDAFGAGMSMATACDVVVVAKNARFGAAFTKVGVMPDMGLLYTLPQRVGLPKARQLMMLSEPVGGEAALEIGLADEMTEPGEALERAIAIADRYSGLAPLAVAMTKIALATGVTSIEDAIRLELDLQPMLGSSADCREGFAAFREKRKPVFRGE
jgi:enoyl-CoA hydratase/carnithine racemase